MAYVSHPDRRSSLCRGWGTETHPGVYTAASDWLFIGLPQKLRINQHHQAVDAGSNDELMDACAGTTRTEEAAMMLQRMARAAHTTLGLGVLTGRFQK
jgi:hypothetical protein